MRLGCTAVGFTIYPGSDHQYDMIEEFKEISLEATEYGLPSVLWSYPRGPEISKEAETSIDTISYSAHIAALLGAHIIKVKPPTSLVSENSLEEKYNASMNLASLSDRINHIKKCAFNFKRIVVFSGGNAKGDKEILEEIKLIKEGGGNGSIIGRNTFQRPKKDALNLLNNIIDIYKN